MGINPREYKTLQTGFTLIELLIVIAILGVLASIAISSYQDYTVRSRVSEAIQASTPFTTAIATYYSVNQQYPVNRADAGQANLISKYVEGVTIMAAGEISVDINEATTGVINITSDSMYIIFRPTVVTGAMDWDCRSNNVVDGTGDNINLTRLVPTTCR